MKPQQQTFRLDSQKNLRLLVPEDAGDAPKGCGGIFPIQRWFGKKGRQPGSRLASLQPGSGMGRRVQGLRRSWMPAAWPHASWALSPLLKTLLWLPVTPAQLQGQTAPRGYQGPP